MSEAVSMSDAKQSANTRESWKSIEDSSSPAQWRAMKQIRKRGTRGISVIPAADGVPTSPRSTAVYRPAN